MFGVAHIITGHEQTQNESVMCRLLIFSICSLKNIRRFYGKITGNQLPVHFPLILQAPVNIFRNQVQYGRKGHVLFFF